MQATDKAERLRLRLNLTYDEGFSFIHHGDFVQLEHRILLWIPSPPSVLRAA